MKDTTQPFCQIILSPKTNLRGENSEVSIFGEMVTSERGVITDHDILTFGATVF